MPDILDIQNKQATGSILSGVGGVASAVVSGLDSVFGWSSKRQENAQKRLMDKQQEQWKEQQDILARQQLEQWNRENEYNDPTNYFKRLFNGAEANGITKAGVLGNMPAGSVGQSATGVTAPGSTSGTGVGGVQQQSISAGMNNVLAGMRQRAEINLIEAQVRNLDQQNKESDSRIDVNKSTVENLDALTRVASNEAVLGPLRQKSLEIANELDAIRLEYAKPNAEADLEQRYANIQTAYDEAYKAYQEGRNAELRNQYVDRESIQRLAESRALAGYYVAQSKVAKELAEKYDAETAKIILESDEFQKGMQDRLTILGAEADWSDVYQYTHTFGQLTDAKYTVHGFMDQNFDARNYYEGVMLSTADKIAKRHGYKVRADYKGIREK